MRKCLGGNINQWKVDIVWGSNVTERCHLVFKLRKEASYELEVILKKEVFFGITECIFCM